jgi:hypothetical protein
MSADFDSPWKEALDAYFEPPEGHRQVYVVGVAK